MTTPLRPSAPVPLARRVREQFVADMEKVLAPLSDAIRARLIELVDSSPSTREMQDRRDAMLAFERARADWVARTGQAWKAAVNPPTATARVRLAGASLELIGDDVVENKILASRLAMAIQEKSAFELNDLRGRIGHLENGEASAQDILRPEALAQTMIEQWIASTLPRDTWTMVKDVIQDQIVAGAVTAYHQTNETLISSGVLPDIDLSKKVRRGADPAGAGRAAGGPNGANESDVRNEGVSGHGEYEGSGRGGESRSGSGGGSRFGSAGSASGHFSDGQGSPGGQQSGRAGTGRGPGSVDRGAGGYPDGGGYQQGRGDGGSSSGARDDGVAGQFGYSGGSVEAHPGGGDAGGGYHGGAAQSRPDGRDSGGGRRAEAQGSTGGSASGRSQGLRGEADGGNARGQDAGKARADGGNRGGDRGAGDGTNGGRSFGEQDTSPGAGGMPSAGGGYGRGPSSEQGAAGVADETRLLTTGTPLAKARQRANGVLGQLRRMLTDRVAGYETSHETRPSPALAEALSQRVQEVHTAQGEAQSAGDEIVVYDDVHVERAAVALRQRTGELKKKAATSTEKATIEIVALMFQSILSEERIPPAVRVWFARLQMPVLRVAIAEPEFFGTLQHPARQLIDRMGSCVMGFDASTINGSALETEIKRVVQVIEQYPETGRRVFQLVYDEFQKFLSRFLTEKGATQRLVSVAQQIEQKETMAVQYTIEMRKMLNEMPVREEIREFLFKVWAEVLAVAAVKNGVQHEETIALKKAASDLVWAASAKPNRQDRAKVIQELPKLLQRLRQGMTLMGVTGSAQEAHIKSIGDTLADAFLSKTDTIPHAQIEAMAKRLAHLEDFVADDPATDLPLDAESIELMLGIDASMIEVVADGGSRPSAAMLAWAQELQLGNWFSLDHNGKINQVQYVWRSERRQLHLFASPDGKSFLVQARRLAAYLQAGLLLPAEEETLTVRATRDALAKLDANPERLLQ